jgi:hypothetical protein
MPSGRELLVVSDRGGIANLELVPLDGGAPRSLTRVTGAVLGPEVSRADGSLWFLTLRSGGQDLRRLEGSAAASAAASGDVVSIRGPLAPAAPPTVPAAGFASPPDTATPRSRDYALGPRRWRVLPGGTAGPDGHTTTLMAANIDPIGRLSVVAQGNFGTRGTWRGGSLAAGYRRLRVGLDAAAWYVEHEPSRARDHLAPASSDARFSGLGVQARLSGEGSNTAYLLRGSVSAGNISNTLLNAVTRVAASMEVRGRLSRSFGLVNVSATGGVFAEAGETSGDAWQRLTSSGTLSVGTARGHVRGDWLRGTVTAPSSGGSGRLMEQFVVGGAANPLFDAAFLSSRIALPAVPAGMVGGRTLQVLRATLGGRSWEPYFVWLGAGDSFEDLKRIAGIERSFSITSLGFARLPGVRARAGGSYSFDDPYRDRARAYASLAFSP